MAAFLPLPDLSLKQCLNPETMLEVGAACAGKGRFPRAFRPKKECIKSYETYFANIFNLNDKGPHRK